MAGNKVIKSVSFNLTVLDDVAMMKHFKRKNFSGYVKKLIMDDMKEKGFEPTVEAEPEKVVIPTAREQINVMREQRKATNKPPLLITRPKHP
jgi:hypothetical protein